MPKQVHIILGVGFVAKIFDYKIGHDTDGTALVSTQFGNVVMGEQDVECTDNNLSTVTALVDDTMNEKLYAMLEKLWQMDCTDTGAESNRTEEQEMVEQHFLNTHRRDETGRFIVRIFIKPSNEVWLTDEWLDFKCKCSKSAAVLRIYDYSLGF